MTTTSIMRPGRKTLCGCAAAILIFGAAVLAPTAARADEAALWECLEDCQEDFEAAVLTCYIAYDYHSNPHELERCLNQADALDFFCQIVCIFQHDPPPK